MTPLVQCWLSKGDIVGNVETPGHRSQVAMYHHLLAYPRLRVYVGRVGPNDDDIPQLTLAVRRPRTNNIYYGVIGTYLGEYPNKEAWELAVAHLRMAGRED